MQRSRSWSDSRGRLTLVLHYPDCVETSLTWVPPRCNVEKSSSKGELSTWAMSRSMSKSKVENSSHSITNVGECLQDYRLISVLLEVVQRKPDYMGSAQLLLGAPRVRERDLITILLPCGVLFCLLRNIYLEVGTCKPLESSQNHGRANRFSFDMEKVRTFLSRTKLSTYRYLCI